MSEHSLQKEVKPENSIILGTEQITSSTSSTTSTSESSMPQTSSEMITSSTTPTISQEPISCENENVISSIAPGIDQENTVEGKLKSFNRFFHNFQKKNCLKIN